MRQRIFPILAVLLLAAALPGCQDAAAGDRAGLFIHFIDPEQTSSALLLCGGQAMLIDGGGTQWGSQVAGYLSQQGITYLDYVVCTSADEPHMGGLSGPLYTCVVGQVLSPVEDAGGPVFADFRRYTEAQGLSPAVPEAGTVFPLGDAQVTVVETDAAAQTLSLQVDYGDTSLQFTSDLEDAVAAVASEAEGELPLGSLVAGSDGTQFFLLDPVQTAPYPRAPPPIGRRRSLLATAGALIQEDVVHTSHDRKQSGHRGPAYSARGIAFSSATAEAPAEDAVPS